MLPRISLEQWRALVAVVEADGFAAAAEALNKSQSTVSYAVHKIQELLDIRAFEMDGRKARLTPAGQKLYRRAKILIDEARRLERTAARFAAGWETELRLAVEIIFPTWLLLECLEKFSREQPEISVELYESIIGGTEELLTSGQVDLALTPRIPQGFMGDPLMSVRFIAAAAPDHPLHRLGRPLTGDDLRNHRHLLVRETGLRRDFKPNWQGSQSRWTFTNKATSIHAARMGLGFAWYGEEMIRRELESGELKRLPLVEGHTRVAQLYLVFADADAAGPGSRRVADLIRHAAGRCS